MSFASKVHKSKGGNIWLIRTNDAKKRPCYFYILMDGTKEPLVRGLQKGQPMVPAEMGKVLASGFGEEPSEDVAARMRDEYGFEPE